LNPLLQDRAWCCTAMLYMHVASRSLRLRRRALSGKLDATLGAGALEPVTWAFLTSASRSQRWLSRLGWGAGVLGPGENASSCWLVGTALIIRSP